MIGRFKVYLKIIFAVFFITGCAPKFFYNPEPKKDIKEWIRNFTRQKSFSYTYELKTATLTITAHGDCIYGWAEHIKGIWNYEDTVIPFEYIGINDREWTKKDKKWEESVRGEESDLLSQIQRVLEFEHYELLSDKNDYFYQFNATLPFLAPERWREMVAYIKISRNNYLPAFIWVGLPDSLVCWQVSLANYNYNIKLESPYYEMKNYEIKIDSSINPAQAIKKINRRLKLLNLRWRLKKEDKKIVLQAPGVYSIDDIKELLAPGRTDFFGIAQKNTDAVRVAYLQSNPNQNVYLSDWQCSGDMVKDVVIKFDNLLKPFMLIKLKRKIELPEKIAIEVDSNIVALVPLDKDKKMDKIVIYSNMRYFDFWKLRSYIAQSLFRIDVLPLAEGSD